MTRSLSYAILGGLRGSVTDTREMSGEHAASSGRIGLIQ